ncbi:GNAT family N-acetyltransferase [Cupriavidus sp. WS]|uniref:GNAT family N-acetyltransferase n=1 Tax=Cupriavidus sp. WS TaxID=1312922 RepID=UPI00350F38A9
MTWWVTATDQRCRGLGGTLLRELSGIGVEECCQRLVLDTVATNISARRFYIREGLTEAIVGFVMQLENPL